MLTSDSDFNSISAGVEDLVSAAANSLRKASDCRKCLFPFELAGKAALPDRTDAKLFQPCVERCLNKIQRMLKNVYQSVEFQIDSRLSRNTVAR